MNATTEQHSDKSPIERMRAEYYAGTLPNPGYSDEEIRDGLSLPVADQGTPGPWIYDDTCAYYSGRVIRMNGLIVAKIISKTTGTMEIDARLICAAVNAVRAAMPNLSDEQRIAALKAGALTAMAETLANLIQAAEMYADMAGEDFRATYARAALEATGGNRI